MKICLIAEGAYPYVTGGVSSWIQSIITQMPEHEFIVYSISTKDHLGAMPLYKRTSNLLEIRDIHLGNYVQNEIISGKRYDISFEEKMAFVSLISGDETNWNILFDLFLSGRIDSILNFLASKDFFDIVRLVCEERFIHVPFTDMFWALRSMVLPLFICIDNEMPEADLYHSVSTGYAGVLGALANYQYNKPYLLTEHGIYTREREEEIIKAKWIKGYFKDIWIDYFYNLSHCAYQYANEVTSLFAQSRNIQIDIGCPPEKTTIIPNGIDVDLFKPEARKKREGLHIGAIVRVVPIKDIRTMLQSFAIVEQTIPDAHFYIIGPCDEDQQYYEECKEYADSLGLKNIVFTGTVNVMDYLTFIDILVLSSISEGQPLVILEGFAMGIPFVATDVGSCSELILGTGDGYGRAGCVVPVMHFHLLAEEILFLCRSEEVRKHFGSNGFNRVQNLYTLPLMIDRYNACYERWSQSNGGNRVSTERTL
ncbi:glycosyltransferase involved in cell wall biosynthesis [Bacillus ectoiniformans]|uniref:GT4 family glycosyltransferase PelF n=1 Tax=Bacillus ectoiniformans TaxID=1494429 RepID=UPI00195A5109|nr:GT4 family glycosyltransferase PelF [Bacillus ectoiniformans]MBM7649090.1 glycosyltransferase involved in cell wall biosynthesis [Bacillus ectoiniformans]